jgi:hypothetical protein
MAETKYGKYIVTDLKQNIAESPWGVGLKPFMKGKGGRLLWLDNEVVPGAFYMECVWILPQSAEIAKKKGTEAHTHDYDEVIAFFGTNLDDPYDLGAEAEFWLDDEKHIINKSCLIFVPKGLKHSPLIFHKVERPVFHFTTGPGEKYF